MREYTYGPFQSRRLKLSLGIDVLPRKKLCTYDCVYCEIGPTQQNRLVSPEYRIKAPPKPDFRKELRDILKYVPHLNSITFGYNGEPTLNANLLDFLKIAKDVRNEMKWEDKPPKLTLFTNSSTLHYDEIRKIVAEFDLVLAKLDAAIEDTFLRTCRPHPKVPSIDTIIDSLVKLKKIMNKGHELAIQCLIYNSYKEDFIPNHHEENIIKLGKAIKKIKPDQVQIYSIARIPAQYFVFAIDEDKKKEITEKLNQIIDDPNVKVNYY